MPLLVYVSREKRPSQPHNFKAGALNTLLRISGIMSNAPYLLVLDCDMYCNDPTSARQAMCFHLDPQMSRSLAFVQYPQMFYNLARNDIYDGQARSAYKTKWQGMDGLQGPAYTGTGYYMKKKALYGSPDQKDVFLLEPEKNFGLSSKFIVSLAGSNKQDIKGKGIVSDAILEEARTLASCTFETNTEWGKEVSDPWFAVFAIVYTSSICQHLYEVLSSGGSLTTWRNEYRMWMMKMITAGLFGCLDFLLKLLGITKGNFRLTNKAVEQDKLEKYTKGKFDFQGAEMFMIPLRLLVILNLVCFVGGMKRVLIERDFEDMFGQCFLSSLILFFSYPILESLLPGRGK